MLQGLKIWFPFTICKWHDQYKIDITSLEGPHYDHFVEPSDLTVICYCIIIELPTYIYVEEKYVSCEPRDGGTCEV